MEEKGGILPKIQ